MVSKILRGALLASLLGLTVVPLGAMTASSLFSKYVTHLESVQPSSFTCRMGGKSISKSLGKIPADAIDSGKKPLVYVYFRKGHGQVIKVSNVEDVFTNMFSEYNKLISFTGAYILDKGRTWKEFSKRYTMKIKLETDNYYDVQIFAKDQPRDNYGVFRISKKNMMISLARFYQRGAMVYKVRNYYKKAGGFIFPVKMVIDKYLARRKQKKRYVIRLFNYRVNPSIDDSVFQK